MHKVKIFTSNHKTTIFSAIQLYYSWPNIYSINIPKIFGKDVPILYKVKFELVKYLSSSL